MQSTKALVAVVTTMAILAMLPGSKTEAADLKIATLLPNQSQWMQDMRAAGKTIEQRTDGRVRLKFYGGGTQGTEDKVLRKIKIGQLHGGTFSPTDFLKQYSAVSVYGLPFVFRSWDEMRYVRDKMDPTLEAGFEDLNFVTFGFVGSFSIVLSNEPIRRHEDMKGKKVWLPQGDTVSYEAMKGLQLSPVALPVTDVLTGLQTGLLDIAAIPPEIAVALQWHTRIKYFTDMPIAYAMSFLAIDKRTFGRLSGDDQAIVREVLTDVYRQIDEKSQSESENAMKALTTIGIERVEPDPGQFAKLQSRMDDANREMAEAGEFPQDLFDAMQGHLDDFRNNRMSSAAAAGN